MNRKNLLDVVVSTFLFQVTAADISTSVTGGITYSLDGNGYWVDSMVPAAGFKIGATAPTWGDFTDANIQVLRFSKTASDLVHSSLQLNHDYKLATTIKPHIHVWYPTAASAAASTNVWSLSYSFGAIGGTFPTSTTVTVTNSGAITQNEHRMISFSDISGSGQNISSILAITVSRIGGDAYDVYDDVIGFMGFDVHYEIDSIGSRQNSAK